MKSKINILFTSSGRRVSLIQMFMKVFQKENINGSILTADNKLDAPTAQISDKHFPLPLVTDRNYVTELLQVCLREKVNLIIPLIDPELLILAENKALFEKYGIKVLVSGSDLIKISSNKINTYQFFKTKQINTPRVYETEEIESTEHHFPMIIKPYNGSSSKGVTIIENYKELSFFKNYTPNAMVQEYISGEEYTVDVMCDFRGNIKTIVPRLRIETRAGEVSKGMTRKDYEIINAVRDLVRHLPNPVGCITVQCFKLKNGEITFIEINPRFGGGIPLSIHAGANFPLWIVELCNEKEFINEDFEWKDNLKMLRYDEAVFLENIGL